MNQIKPSQIDFIPKGSTHVDDWIDSSPDFKLSQEERNDLAYAKFVLNWFRMPADKIIEFKPWMSQFELYCTFDNIRYKVVGASRLGSVMLTRIFATKAPGGYETATFVDHCSNWGSTP